MVRAGPSPSAVVLPKVEFERVEDEVSSGGPPGIQDGQARAFGYNDGYPYVRPELYIRHIEPLEIDLARQVEYDMDEQDEEWLEAVNVERKKEHMDRVSAETFEIIMDRLEKEWFDLTKNLPKSDLAMPSEDSTCAVCDDSEGENSNAIVFCDGCNLAVHQDCYGVPYIPEGQWLCRKCTVSPENPVQCYLCPNEGGAFKQTIHGEWVHLLCAIWVPETRVANDVFMEPVTGIEKISKQRWKLRCSICDVREGACIQCAKSSCFVAFHATCARQEKLLLPMKTVQGAEQTTLQAYCERHLPKEQHDIREAYLLAAANEESSPTTAAAASTKAARAYNKTYKPGPPIVPAIIVNRITQYIARIKIRKKVDLVQLICRYWSLKREARRGAPLLKRLHLEPWTAGRGGGGVEEGRMKLEQLKMLKKDLTHIKMLTLLVKWREVRKLKQTEIIHQVLSLALYPHEAALRMALETIMGADKSEFFKHPVNKNDVPDYFDIVLNPMCWSIIEDRLDKHEYWDVKTFRDDIDLVINNALLYNAAGTPFHKAALRIRTISQPVLANIDKMALPPHAISQHPHPSLAKEDGGASPSTDEPNVSSTPAPMLPIIGDLESPLEILDLLLSSDRIQDGLNLEVTSDPITSLLRAEESTWKPPPPASPVVSSTSAVDGLLSTEIGGAEDGTGDDHARSQKSGKKKSSGKKDKRDRKAEAERARARKEAASKALAEGTGEVVGTGDGNGESGEVEMKEVEDGAAWSGSAHVDFREPRATRAAMAAAVAFEKEAREGHPPPPPSGASTEAGPSTANDQERGPRKRTSIPGPTGAILPRVVSAVDNKDLFDLFDAGWILPPESKRHGRVSSVAHVPDKDAGKERAGPPPRKKQKIEPSRSRRQSAASTIAASEANAVSSPMAETPGGSNGPTSTKPSSTRTTTKPNSTRMEIDPFSVPPGQAFPPGASFDETSTQRTAVDPRSGKLVIEELDTPFTRKQKSMRRKALKNKDAAETTPGPGSEAMEVGDADADADESTAPSTPAPQPPPATAASTTTDVTGAGQAGPSKIGQRRVSIVESGVDPMRGDEDEDDDQASESDLSALSDIESGSEAEGGAEGEGEDSGPVENGKRKGKAKGKKAEPAPAPVTGTPGRKKPVEARRGKGKRVVENFESGTLVWAKAESFPWWPAVVFDPDQVEVSSKILAGFKEAKSKRKVKLYIVRFYDRGSTWQYLPREKLMLLGEDMSVDSDMIAAHSVKQRWKSAKLRTGCREAYRTALGEMEAKSDGGSGPDLAELLLDASLAGDSKGKGSK